MKKTTIAIAAIGLMAGIGMSATPAPAQEMIMKSEPCHANPDRPHVTVRNNNSALCEYICKTIYDADYSVQYYAKDGNCPETLKIW